MKEWIVDLFPIGGGMPTKVRVFAPNQAAAIKLAKDLHPNYRTGSIKPIN